MNQCQLQVKAALIYLSLMFPDRERRSILSILLPGEKEDQLEYPELPTEFLSSEAKSIIENYEIQLRESPDGDLIPEHAVILLIDTLFNKKSEIDLVKRSCLLATVLTLCAAFRIAYNNDELGCSLQQAYNVYSKVAGTQPIEFSSLDQNVYGSYIGVDCLKEEESALKNEEQFNSQIETDFLPKQEKQHEPVMGNHCRKFPRFEFLVKGKEREYLKVLYGLLSDTKEYCLFEESTCSIDNFLSLFECVSGYEGKFPTPICAASSLDYWSVFLSTIYKRKNKMLDNSEMNRHDCSVLATEIILDQNGKKCSSSTFDMGRGGNMALSTKEDRNKLKKKYTEALQKARDIILPPSIARQKVHQH